MNIKVLGGGCNKCETLLANAKEAVANVGVEAEVEYITDFAVIAGYGIMSTPAIIVDEKIVSMGKVLKSSEIEKFLKQRNKNNAGTACTGIKNDKYIDARLCRQRYRYVDIYSGSDTRHEMAKFFVWESINCFGD